MALFNVFKIIGIFSAYIFFFILRRSLTLYFAYKREKWNVISRSMCLLVSLYNSRCITVKKGPWGVLGMGLAPVPSLKVEKINGMRTNNHKKKGVFASLT